MVCTNFQDLLKIPKDMVFTQYAPQFGFSNNNSMQLQAQGIMDDNGGESDRYIQICNGYPVEGTMMNVISQYGVVLYVNGYSLPTLNTDVSGQVNEADALARALKTVNAPKYAWQDQSLEASIKVTVRRQFADTTLPTDTTIDMTRTFYPKGQLVIAKPYGDTSTNDSSKYALCWKFAVNAMYWDTVVVEA